MANIFSQEFINFIASKTKCNREELESAINDFLGQKMPAAKTAKVSEEDDTEDFIKKSVSNVHKCERIPRNKTTVCGKTAKKSIEIDGKLRWYCGTEKSGCYPSILSSIGKKEKDERVAKPVPSEAKSNDIKSKSLIHKIIKKEEIHTIGMMVNGKKIFMNPDSRVLFNRERIAYGMLDKDDKTILPISDENIRWLEAGNIPIEQQNQNSSSDEEEEEGEFTLSGDEEDEESSDDEEDDEIVL